MSQNDWWRISKKVERNLTFLNLIFRFSIVSRSRSPSYWAGFFRRRPPLWSPPATSPRTSFIRRQRCRWRASQETKLKLWIFVLNVIMVNVMILTKLAKSQLTLRSLLITIWLVLSVKVRSKVIMFCIDVEVNYLNEVFGNRKVLSHWKNTIEVGIFYWSWQDLKFSTGF